MEPLDRLPCRRPRSTAALGRLCLVVVALFAVSASGGTASAFGAVIADWEMNEPPGATTMVDSSGSNLNGTVGSGVVTGVVTNGATGYRWFGPDPESYHPERLVLVESPLLNPGLDDYAITLRVYTGAGDQNILQKGQSNTPGGMFKIDMLQGQVICMYHGSAGRASVRSTQTIWDNSWHTLRCERRANSVTLTIDGGPSRTTRKPTGNIANNWEFSIGGKSRCDPPAVQCDYFIGRIDSIVVEKLEGLDSTKPQVQITDPGDGTSLPRGQALTIGATASDNVGVTKVEFRANGSLKCTDTQTPYTCPWTPWTASGTQNTLRATAYDAVGNSSAHSIVVYTQ
jgi:Bacterial Ig domain/Laminin G domain